MLVPASQFWNELAEFYSHPDESAILIDLRSEDEFLDSRIPCSINLPILNNEERHLVGLEYKTKGQQSAIELGFRLVPERLQEARTLGWMKAIKRHPIRYLSCWRGGLRSQLAEQWLAAKGVEISRIEGGTKEVRRCAIREFLSLKMVDGAFILYGRTGCGKTEFLRDLCRKSPKLGFLDLESSAHHRGSAFGAYLGQPQPRQVEFEYRVALGIRSLKNSGRKICLEGESRMIGKRTLPSSLFHFMSELPIVVLDCPLKERIQRIYQEYFCDPLRTSTRDEVRSSFLASLKQIEKRLGGKLYRELAELRVRADQEANEKLNLELIEALLTSYYDPLYDRFLSNQSKVWRRVDRGRPETITQLLADL